MNEALISVYREKILGLLGVGGPVVLVLLMMSVVTLALAFKKWIDWLRYGGTSYSSVHWCAAAVKEAKELTQVTRLDPLLLREEITHIGRCYLAKAREYSGWFDFVAVAAPLLGLLGTVLGMIEAFRAMERAGSQVDPAMLSGGIWTALLTTAVGLLVALPATALSMWFEQRAQTFKLQLEKALTRSLSGYSEVSIEKQSMIRASSPVGSMVTPSDAFV